MPDVLNELDEPALPAFVVPPKPPPIVIPPPRVPKILRVKQRVTNIPAHALRDPRIRHAHWRMLAALGVHANLWGALWPTLARLQAVAGRSRTWVDRQMHDLREWGYVRRLRWGDYPGLKRRALARRVNKSKRLPALRQVLWEADWPPPPRQEEAPTDPTLRTVPWMFSNATDQEGET